jgi:hypothetical protein
VFMTILNALPLARLRFELETLEESDVPPHKGDMLRMALLWWLSEFWCPLPDRCRHGCRRPDACAFGRLASPPVDPSWSSQTKYLVGNTPSPAYVLWDYRDRRTHFERGAAWTFEITLVGEFALSQIPAVVAAVQQGAESGMGRIRLRSALQRVVAVGGANGAAEQVLAEIQEVGGQPALTWQSYRMAEIALRYAEGLVWSEGLEEVSALSLRFLSPVQIKERGQRLTEPRFGAIARALVRRLRILSEVHGAGEWPHGEYGPLLDLAEGVRLEHHETFQSSYERSSRQSGRYEIEGLLGRAWYRGTGLTALLPILWLGQWLHVGKGYVLGNGRYSIVV